jgi:hypothetical protein
MYFMATSLFLAVLQGEGHESDRLDFCKIHAIIIEDDV